MNMVWSFLRLHASVSLYCSPGSVLKKLTRRPQSDLGHLRKKLANYFYCPGFSTAFHSTTPKIPGWEKALEGMKRD